MLLGHKIPTITLNSLDLSCLQLVEHSIPQHQPVIQKLDQSILDENCGLTKSVLDFVQNIHPSSNKSEREEFFYKY